MNMTEITQLIGSLGFPIVACIGLAYYSYKQQLQNNSTITKLGDALNNNTLALTKLAEKIDKDKTV